MSLHPVRTYHETLGPNGAQYIPIFGQDYLDATVRGRGRGRGGDGVASRAGAGRDSPKVAASSGRPVGAARRKAPCQGCGAVCFDGAMSTSARVGLPQLKPLWGKHNPAVARGTHSSKKNLNYGVDDVLPCSPVRRGDEEHVPPPLCHALGRAVQRAVPAAGGGRGPARGGAIWVRDNSSPLD